MEWENKLKEVFEEIIWQIPERVGVIFSGGVDSSFLAYLINMHDKDVHLYTAGSKDSHDKKWAEKAAVLLGLPIKFIEPDAEEIRNAIREIKDIEYGIDALSILIDLPLYFVCKYSVNPILVSGQGSDELFLGYKKYENKNTSAMDLEKLLHRDIMRESKIAQRFNEKIIFPYLDISLISLANRIPDEFKIKDGIHKYILRNTALDLGLNPEIALKPKKSAQYSSGFKYIVDRMALNEGKRTYEFIRDL
ncbi:MAG: asparagine synthase C-terminal domain-containing protein [Thermoplasmata archaeon]